MKKTFGKLTAVAGALVSLLACAPGSWAQCPVYRPAALHSGWDAQPGPAMLLRAALVNGDQRYKEPSIVGFWHIKLSVAGTPIDGGTQQWQRRH